MLPVVPLGDAAVGSLEDFPGSRVAERMIERRIIDDTETVTLARRTTEHMRKGRHLEYEVEVLVCW